MTEPENDGKDESKSWSKVVHCRGKCRRSVVDTRIPHYLRRIPTVTKTNHFVHFPVESKLLKTTISIEEFSSPDNSEGENLEQYRRIQLR